LDSINCTVDYKKKASAWAYAGGKPSLNGSLRTQLDDFIVTEILSFELSGEGEHVYLNIEKRGLNTIDLVQKLSKFIRIPVAKIAYAGLKDKQAHTTQWLSVYITGFEEPDWYGFESEHIKIHQVSRHNKKLKRGAIRQNQFSIVLRSLRGDIDQAEQRLQDIKLQGVPNYFGEQRFGFDFQNLNRVQELVSGKARVKNRHRRGLYYSAARSFLFNEVLSQRILDKNWNGAIEGDVMSLNGSRSFFKLEQLSADIHERIQRHDIHPSGPLVGAGESDASQLAFALEHRCVQAYIDWCDWLVAERVSASRRSLRVIPMAFSWQWTKQNQVRLDFNLPSGCYATAVLREFISY